MLVNKLTNIILMNINLSKGELNTASEKWNRLVDAKNKNKNYFIPTSREEYDKLDRYAPYFQINHQHWYLSEEAKQSFSQLVDIIRENYNLKNTASHNNINTIIYKELVLEISNRVKDTNNKRKFSDAWLNIQCNIENIISDFDFFFIVDGVELVEVEKIGNNRIEMFIFDRKWYDSFDDHWTRDFLDENFLGNVCIKSGAYGDSDVARQIAYRQAKELINYFRFIICYFFPDRITEQVIKINLLAEAHSNKDSNIIKRHKDNSTILSYGRGLKPLQKFSIDKDLLENMLSDGFLDDIFGIINTLKLTQIEECISTAIYWIGEAQNESDMSIAFIKYWTALECMFVGQKQNPTKSLEKGISIINMFTNYKFIKAEDKKETLERIRHLYHKRSNIIHQGKNYLTHQVIDERDISQICKYTAWSIFSLLELRSNGYTDMSQVDKEIERLDLL
jgi:Apea-like HEPN